MAIFKKIEHNIVQGASLGRTYFGQCLKEVCFFVVDELVIDSGSRHCRKLVLDYLEDKKVNQLLLTHHHEDHSANVKAIIDKFQIEGFSHPLCCELMQKIEPILPYQQLMFGKADEVVLTPIEREIETNKYIFELIFTPGHSEDHYVLYEKNEGWLFSADLYVASKLKFFRAGENVYTQIKSLKKVLEYDFDTLFCSHSGVLNNGKKRIQQKISFFEEITEKSRYFDKKGCSINQIIKELGYKEHPFIKWFSFNDVSFEHLICSAVFDYNNSLK